MNVDCKAYLKKSYGRALMRALGVVLTVNISLADAAPVVTAEDYAHAERFLSWNASRYVVNGDIQHHWIGNEDRFWYLRRNVAGGTEFILVDAASGRQTPAFDQRELAAALNRISGSDVDPNRLPFSSFRFVNRTASIQFEISGLLWTCQTKPVTCVQSSQPQGKLGEVVSPNGKWVVFSKDHNLQLRSNDGSEQIALTTDGTERYDYGRVPVDPVTARRHPENMPLDLAWSPDSKYILTSRLDERNVRDAYLIQSVPDDGSSRPALYSYPSDFVGDEVISETPLLIINVGSRQQTILEGSALNAPSFGSIITGYAWWSQDGSKAYFVSRDRFWKSVTLHEFDAVGGKTRELLHETSDTMVRVNAGDPFGEGPAVRILRNGDVIWYSDRDGWGHLYYYNGATGKQRNQITKGDWQVSRIVRIDETHGCIYFMGRGRELNQDPYQQYLYRINFDGSGLRLLTPEPAEHSVAASMPTMGNDGATVTEKAGFSPSGRYFVDSYSRPDLPPVFVLRSADGQLVKTLEKADISELRSGGYVPIEPFHVLAADGKTAIYGNLFRPSAFDPTRKYPIIDASYPGPQMIRTGKSFGAAAFHFFESQSLAELGFIVVTIDGRGTPFRSKAFLDHSYGQLARTSDLDDHIAGIRQLAQRYPFMDINRVGIDGVSAGGYVAARALLAYPDFYKVAVAASGDHDLRVSSAAWGETYNGPLDAGNYQDVQNELLAGNLRGRLLLMHGDMDDRCPPSQTLLLVDALIKKNRDFDLLIIPNGNHGAFMSPYFIRRKWDYFVRNLLGAEPPAGYEISLPKAN